MCTSCRALPDAMTVRSCVVVVVVVADTHNAIDIVEGLTIGPYRVKCDTIIKPKNLWLDNEFQDPTAAELVAGLLGCGKANRKIAL